MNKIQKENNVFSDKKRRSFEVGKSYARLSEKISSNNEYYLKKAENIFYCGNYLEFLKYRNGAFKLSKANFCKSRLCPMCAWRRSLKIFGQTQQIVDYMLKEKKYRFVFLTLTVKNCSSDDLKETMDLMFSSIKRFFKYKELDIVKGYFRALEVTFNKKDNTYHPHFHILLVVPSAYFKKENYITQERYTELWNNALQVDYRPIVDIRVVKGRTSKTVAELSKYPVKDSEFIIKEDTELTDEVIRTLDDNLKSRQLIAYGREMLKVKKLLKLDNPETSDLVETDNKDELKGDVIESIVSFKWKVGFSNYEVVERPQ